MNLKNKVAVVTGGAGGIGSALSEALAAKGAKVVVSDLDMGAASKLAEKIGGLAVECDVSRESAIQHLIDASQAEFGPIDLFCSNAGFGVGEPSHAASASDDVWQKNWNLHVMAHVWAARALIPQMQARGDGYLLNVASAAGLLVQVGDAAYSATKHAAVSLAESLAITHGDQGIKVSVVCPQYVNTDILAISAEQRKSAMPGVISPQECANSIVDGIESETFMILPHKEVSEYYQQRASNPSRWVDGMRRYRASLLDEKGRVNFGKILGL